MVPPRSMNSSPAPHRPAWPGVCEPHEPIKGEGRAGVDHVLSPGRTLALSFAAHLW